MKCLCSIRAAVLAAYVLAGCATSPPMRYYTLDMQCASTAPHGVHIGIEHLRLAQPLARREIMIQASPTQLDYYALDQWAATLDELVAHKLEAEFGECAEATRDLVLRGRILAFNQVDVPGGAQAHAKIAVALYEPGARLHEPPLFEKTYEARGPATEPTAPAVVEALSRCLEEVAAAIVEDARGL